MSVLYTKRLILRPFKVTDAEAMFKNWTYDERVAKYCRWHPHTSVDMTKQLLKMYLNEAENGFEYRWGIELQATNELIGAIDVVDITDDGKTAIIGYVLSFNQWNKGFATEALKRIILELFENGVETIKADHHIDNVASGRVMEKCGMKFTHFDRVQKKFGSNELCEVKWYQIKNK